MHKGKKHTSKRTRKHRGGYYSFSGQVGTGAPLWTRHTEVPPLAGGRRKRKGKKSTRRHKKGGSRFGAVSASYQGKGSAGMADYVATNTKVPPFGGPAGGAFNNAGAQPGSGYGSFVRAN